MRTRQYLYAIIGAISVMCMTVSSKVSAQEPANLDGMQIGELVAGSIKLMKARNWAEALRWNEHLVKEYGDRAKTMFGPQFGTIYYRKGICEMQLKKWGEAMNSFETCYKDYHNNDPEKKSANQFDKLCLLRWGEAAVGAEQWDLALDQFKKFMNERKRTDKYDPGKLFINYALCYYNIGDLVKGNENFETVIKNKVRFATSDSSILTAFQALVEAAIEAENEQALLDFIAKNRGAIIIEPFMMHQFAPLFMKMAADAIAADMERAAMQLYQLIPSTEVALMDTKEKLEAMGDLPQLKMGGVFLSKENLEKRMEALEMQKNGAKNLDVIRLAALAYLHEKHGNIRGAYSSYLQLELYHSNADKREDYLYNLVRTAFTVDVGAPALVYANRFLKDFPQSDKVKEVRRMMLTTLFANGEYEECIERAKVMLPELAVGTEVHDMCLYVLAGSYYYTAQYETAQPLLDDHVKTYPESTYKIPATYFQASNKFYLGFLEEAAKLLDAFLTKYPDASENVYMPYALYDRATIHYQVQELEPAYEVVDSKLIDKFPDCNILDQAYNLKGNILYSQEKEAEAETAYLRGLEIAEARGNIVAAAESLNNIVSLKVNQGEKDEAKLDEALPFVDKFWKSYAEGGEHFKNQMAMIQFPVLEKADRLQEAIDKLERQISIRAKDPLARGLETMLAIYTENFLKINDIAALKKKFVNFPDIGIEDKAARALMQISIIKVFENEAKEAQKLVNKGDAGAEAKLKDANARVTVEFQNLKNDFQVKELATSILIKVGDYLRTKTAAPREGLSYYDEAIERKDEMYLFQALSGRADIYGNSKNPSDLAKALEDFKRIYDESEDPKLMEFSQYRMAELLLAKGDLAEAQTQAKAYLDTASYRKYKPDVKLLLAKAYDKQNMTNDAIKMYLNIWSADTGNIRVSAPAMLRYMELLWDRNQPAPKDKPNTAADRQGAYVAGWTYATNTRPLVDKMTAEELKMWQEVEVLVKRYETNPNIKSMAEIQREKEANE